MQPPIVCPSFYELKFAYGCPLGCNYCYLQGTFQRIFRMIYGDKYVLGMHPPTLYSNMTVSRFENEIRRFSEEIKEQCLLNSGELADSLMFENDQWFGTSFSKFIIPLMEELQRHKVLFLTKIANVKNVVKIAESLEECTKLLESGFEYITEMDGVKIFRKRK